MKEEKGKFSKSEEKIVTFTYDDDNHHYSKSVTVDGYTDKGIEKLEEDFKKEVEEELSKKDEIEKALAVLKKHKYFTIWDIPKLFSPFKLLD